MATTRNIPAAFRPQETAARKRETPAGVTPDIAALYKGKAGRIDIVRVPPVRIAYIDGVGLPPNPAFTAAIGALFAVSYSAKFAAKAATGESPKVLPVSTQWTVEGAPETWAWTMLIPQLPPIDADAVRAAVRACQAKKPDPALALVRTKMLREGLCAQTLHVGPYDTVPATIDRLMASLPELGYRPSGRYHELYVGDPNRVAPEKLKTICRIPIARA